MYHKNDPRRTWQTINEPLTSRKSDASSVKEPNVNGIPITNSTDLSDVFNEHFSTIASKLANEIPPALNGKTFLDYFGITDKRSHFTPTNANQVLAFLNKLRQSEATGLGKISESLRTKLIRECADLICTHYPRFSIVL